jgi:heat shock protein HslJ
MTGTRSWWMVAAALAVWGCSDRGKELRDLDGREFIAQTVTGRELVAGTEIRMSFRDESVSVHAGCNSMFGMYSIEDGVLRVDGVGSTAIGCDGPRHAQDEWVSELLVGRPKIALEGPRLTLTGDGVKLVMLDREMASPDRPLVGTNWIGNGIGDEVAISFSPGASQVTVSFADDGGFEVFTSCRQGTGTFTTEGTTIQFEGLVYEDGIDCSSTPAGPGVDMQVAFVLDGSDVEFEIEESNLTLKRAGKLLLFRADE